MTLAEQIAALNARIDEVVRWQVRHDRFHLKEDPTPAAEVTPVHLVSPGFGQLTAEATIDIVGRAVDAEQRRKPVVLIVDDALDWQALYKIKFSATATLLHATNYLEAISLLNTTMPVLVILDIVLSGTAHSGIDVLKHLRRQVPGGAGVHVIVVSGLGDDPLTQKAIKESNDNGPIEFVEKFKVLNHLDSTLHKYLER